MQLELTEGERAFRDELRDWLDVHLSTEFRAVQGRGGPDDDDAWEIRRAWDQELGAGGWIGVTWPEAYGGRGASLAEEALLQMELAAAGAPARGGFHGETLLAPTLLNHGSEEQKTSILPDLAAGRTVWCQGYSEPGAGSDLAGVRTRGTVDGSELVVHGQKIWTTFAHRASWMFAIVRTEVGSSRHAGLSYVLLPLDQPQVTVVPIRTMTGDSAFNEVFLDGARTPVANIVGAPGDGWRVAMSTLGHERATSVLGHQFAFGHELELLVHELGKRADADDPVLRDRVADAVVGLEVLRANNLRVLAAATTRGEFGPEASIGKYLWSTWHQRFTELALDVLGADALLGTEGGERHQLTGAFLRARAETIYAGTTQIQLNIIAERVLGLPKEPRP